MTNNVICTIHEDTFALGESIGRELKAGDIVLLTGGLGAGKTLLTKGILNALDFDIDEVTSPSFTLVNLYKTEKFDVYHIDLWRIDEGNDTAFAVGLDEILDGETNVAIIEWAEKLSDYSFTNRTIKISIEGEGDDPRLFAIDGLGWPIRDGVI
jgi:tRNA threonylcarbamoyladenosine biosynthesis protein TsaE